MILVLPCTPLLLYASYLWSQYLPPPQYSSTVPPPPQYSSPVPPSSPVLFHTTSSSSVLFPSTSLLPSTLPHYLLLSTLPQYVPPPQYSSTVPPSSLVPWTWCAVLHRQPFNNNGNLLTTMATF